MAYITKEQTAIARKIANNIGKEKGFKFSVSKNHSSSLQVMLMAGRKITLDDLEISGYMTNLINKHGLGKFKYEDRHEFEIALNEFLNGGDIHRELSKYLQLSEIVIDGKSNGLNHFKEDSDIVIMMNNIETEIKKSLEWYNNSDSMTDYFDTAFYYDAGFGKWDKPYKVSEIKKESVINDNIDFSELLFSADINEFTHTKTKEVLQVAKLKSTLNKDVFKNFSKWIKETGIGYYSRYAKGFVLA